MLSYRWWDVYSPALFAGLACTGGSRACAYISMTRCRCPSGRGAGRQENRQAGAPQSPRGRLLTAAGRVAAASRHAPRGCLTARAPWHRGSWECISKRCNQPAVWTESITRRGRYSKRPCTHHFLETCLPMHPAQLRCRQKGGKGFRGTSPGRCGSKRVLYAWQATPVAKSHLRARVPQE